MKAILFIILILQIGLFSKEKQMFKFNNKVYQEFSELENVYKSEDLDFVINFHMAYTQYYSDNFLHQKEINVDQLKYLEGLFNFSNLKKLNDLYIKPLRKKIRRDKSLATYKAKTGVLSSFALFENEYIRVEELLKSKKIPTDGLSDFSVLHPHLYIKPLSEESINERNFFHKKRELFDNKLKMLRMKGINPVADIVVFKLGQHPSDGVAYQLIRDYAESIKDAVDNKKERQLDYLLQLDHIQEIYPKFEKYYKLLGQWYSQNPAELKSSRDLLSVIGKICGPILDKHHLIEKEKISKRKKEALEKEIELTKQYDHLKPKSISDPEIINNVVSFLKSSLLILKNNNIDEVFEILTLDNSVAKRELGSKNSFGAKYQKYNKEYDFNNQLQELIVLLLEEEKTNWFVCENNDVFLVLPKAKWKKMSKTSPRYNSMDALRLVWIKDKEWRIYNTTHNTNKLKYLVDFK